MLFSSPTSLTRTLTYSVAGTHAKLFMTDTYSPGACRQPRDTLLIEWDTRGLPSASAYRYGFAPKNVLVISHMIDKTLSDMAKVEFASALDLDACLACLPRGKEVLAEVDAELRAGQARRE